MTGSNPISIHDPVSDDIIYLEGTSKEDYKILLDKRVEIEEIYKTKLEEVSKAQKAFIQRNKDHYKIYRELEKEIEAGKITTKDFTQTDTFSHNTIQNEFIKFKEQVKEAEENQNRKYTENKTAILEFKNNLVDKYREDKVRKEYDELQVDIDRCEKIVTGFKKQIKNPSHPLSRKSIDC